MTDEHTIAFTVPGMAATAGSKRAFAIKTKGGKNRAIVVDDNKKLKPWQGEVRAVAMDTMGGRKLMDGEVSLECVFVFARPRSHLKPSTGDVRASAPRYPSRLDLSKLIRGLEDGLNGIVWRDDSQVVHVVGRKEYGDHDETRVKVREIDASCNGK